MRRLRLPLLILLLAGLLRPALAQDLFMVRSRVPFAEAMLMLQEAVREQGYTLSRVQRVDVGLTNMGYKTDKYRVVFFGKPEQVRRLTREHPELIPYLPLKIAIFAEETDTLLIAANPRRMAEFYGDDELTAVFDQWAEDIQAMLDRLQAAEGM
ncbi:uncharacterized protein FOKN1_0312 [Thiohalobacter thiocyanaticus]|uniref:DUF302 domain-containing protein n=1 Tax=Thiohalobacter thiocyanaticus TaxID=585455 RepID=A0A1Z4VM69_9GAMM|nr:DUF302 domain-containing protein [Thiohalobacter thiocyanaticus]BAZ92716.1 uncharacterized protein FOKN1_0312 [Thiohalobacter thiocyanaticus]